MRLINKIIIHCSASSPSMNIGVKEINAWHLKKGWQGVGYHYVIRRDGTIEKGRNLDLIGAHCKGENANSIGICYVGGVNENGKAEDNRTQDQKESLRKLISSLNLVFGPLDIFGHNEFSDKACPSFNVQKEVWSWAF